MTGVDTTGGYEAVRNPQPIAPKATLRRVAEHLRKEAGRMEWDGMGQSTVYNKGQQEGLCYAASIVERWADAPAARPLGDAFCPDTPEHKRHCRCDEP